MHLSDHLPSQFLSLFREYVFLLFSEDLHNLVQLLRRIILDIKEIVETTSEARIYTEQIFHLHPITGSNDHELSAIVLHPFHQFLQSLSPLIITFSCSTQGSQCISLVNKKDSSLCLIAESVYDLWCLTLIRTHHLRTVYFHDMTTIKIADGSQYLSKFTSNCRLTSTGITRQDDVHTHLFLFSQATFRTLYAVLHSIGNLAHSTFHLIHADEEIKIFENLINSPFFGHIPLDILFLHPYGLFTTTDEMCKDILCSLYGKMSITKCLILDLQLIFKISHQLIIRLG